jgi:hypothetical protein
MRGTYDRATVHAILDEALVCHLGFVADGQPFVLPTMFVRHEERLFVHGAAAGRFLRTLAEGVDACFSVTLLDALVLARSAILSLPLEEVSAKIRRGPPVDDEDDLTVPVWAGVVPISLRAGVPEWDGLGANVLDPPVLPRALRGGSTP